jgi:hypothetical protein
VPVQLNYPTVWLGVDPGAGGGLVEMEGDRVSLTPMPDTEEETWQWFWRNGTGSTKVTRALIERISPLAVGFKDGSGAIRKNAGSMSKLYGHYRMLRAFLVASQIPFEPISASDWQFHLGIPKREKRESDTQWKNRLKRKANSLYPHARVTLATADALLIAEVCRQKYGKEGVLCGRSPTSSK